MKLLSIKALAVAAALVSGGGASAATLNVGAGWTSFVFGAVGTYAKKTYTFTTLGHAALTIVDGYFSGDRFEVFADNISRGLTSLPVNLASKAGNKYDLALANPNFSSRSFHFGPGTYTISLLVKTRSGVDTANHLGGIRVDAAQIPVPAAGLMLFSALGAAAALRKRRKRAI